VASCVKFNVNIGKLIAMIVNHYYSCQNHFVSPGEESMLHSIQQEALILPQSVEDNCLNSLVKESNL
jgi:hypothetical protein